MSEESRTKFIFATICMVVTLICAIITRGVFNWFSGMVAGVTMTLVIVNVAEEEEWWRK